MTRRLIAVTVAALILFLGWQTWRGIQQNRKLEAAAQDLILRANSAIFDANWALEQVQDPAAPESEVLIRQAAEDLIIARERLMALDEAAFRATIPSWDVTELSDRAHVVALGLKGSVQSGKPELVYSYRNYLRVVTENLPYPNSWRDLKTFSESIAQVRAIGRDEGFTLAAVPSAPPEMQLVISGSYSPVKRGGYCWRELGHTNCTDKANPADLVAETSPTAVSPSSKTELHFAWPPEPGSVKLWQQIGQREPMPVLLAPDMTFALPQEIGTYVYWAEASWEPGNGTYAFQVTIK